MAADRPLRILHLTTASEPGGLSRYICDLCVAMKRMGHDVRVGGARGPWHHLFEDAQIPWIELPLAGGPLGLWRSGRRLQRELADHPADVIHTHYRRATMVARKLQQEHRPPILYTIHLTDIPLRRWGRLFTDFGDHTHVASGEARRWAVEVAGVAPFQVSLIPHGVHVERWPVGDEAARVKARQQFLLEPDDRVAAFVGRLDHPKNEDWLLTIAHESRATIPNLKILVAGTGPHLEQFLRHVRDEHLSDRVIWAGELMDPLPVYHAADALLLPSAREGFSLVCAEAMCAGIPVLRTRTAGTEELIVENVTGLSTAIDLHAFVVAALEFLSNRDRLRTMGAAAALHIRQKFSFDQQLNATLALYEQMRR